MTPQKLTKKAGGTISSSSISKASQLKDSRNNYMPSRFISDRPPNKNLPHELLHSTAGLYSRCGGAGQAALDAGRQQATHPPATLTEDPHRFAQEQSSRIAGV